MHPPWLEARPLRQTAEDQKSARPCEPSALRVQEELGAVAPIEKRPAAREVATKRVNCLAAEGHDPLLVALARGADEAPFEVDAATLEPDRLAHPQARAVQQLDKGSVAQGARSGSLRRFHESLRLTGRERTRQSPRPFRKPDLGSRVVRARTDQDLVPQKGAQCCRPARDRRGGEALRA